MLARDKHPYTFTYNSKSSLGSCIPCLSFSTTSASLRERKREGKAAIARATNDNCAHATLGSLTPFFSNPTLVRRSVHSSNPPVRVEPSSQRSRRRTRISICACQRTLRREGYTRNGWGKREREGNRRAEEERYIGFQKSDGKEGRLA